VTEEPIPTLDDVIAVAASGKRRMLLEIKPDERRQRYPGIEEKVVAILDRHGVTGSDGRDGLRARYVATCPRAAPRHHGRRPLFARTLRALGSTLAKELDAAPTAAVSVIVLHQDLVDTSIVAAARQHAMTLGVWTVNEPAPFVASSISALPS
jgi:glycerophosphoryl diester phosphodiesterase